MGLLQVQWRKAAVPVVVGVWGMLLIPGLRSMLAYETTAGRQGVAPMGWPETMPAVGAAALPTLVIALHPKCSCSQATLSELVRAAKDFDHPYNAVMLIYTPRGADYRWRDVSMYREAQEALHAQVMLDEEGQMAQRFGAETSGEVLYYSGARQGVKRRLLFAGGVTGSRGMAGDNAGIEALKMAYKSEREPEHAPTPVFGCGLLSAVLSAPEWSTR